MEATVHSLMEKPIASSMAGIDIVRSWKDPKYRRSLSLQQLETLPQHPAGYAMLSDQELKAASGLMDDEEGFGVLTTSFDCTSITFRSWKSCGC
jgi:mersacidin/lichenicidin family type 2 lantibiotic